MKQLNTHFLNSSSFPSIIIGSSSRVSFCLALCESVMLPNFFFGYVSDVCAIAKAFLCLTCKQLCKVSQTMTKFLFA